VEKSTVIICVATQFAVLAEYSSGLILFPVFHILNRRFIKDFKLLYFIKQINCQALLIIGLGVNL